jgi:nucleoside-diphosphate-sugar epimerase
MKLLNSGCALILGSGGYLGQRILDSGGDRYQPLSVSRIRTQKDLVRFAQEVEDALKTSPEAALVNCIGARVGFQDEMELLNALVPKALVRVSAIRGTKLIHLGSAAETLKITDMANLGSNTQVSVSSRYGQSKRSGAQACLAYDNSTVLRIYNLHGLPHPPNSGLHELCRRVRGVSEDLETLPLVNTTRDYVHWRDVSAMVEKCLNGDLHGLVEVCSGFGVSMSEIVEGFQSDIQEIVSQQLVTADLFQPSIGPNQPGDSSYKDKNELLKALRSEVIECVSS